MRWGIRAIVGESFAEIFLGNCTTMGMRQPIAALFSWIEQKTNISMAFRVRSEDGLLVHVFGRLAAACFLLAFYS